jgi:hypothetical protein
MTKPPRAETMNPVPPIPSGVIITSDDFFDSFSDVVEEKTSEFEAESESDDNELVDSRGLKRVRPPSQGATSSSKWPTAPPARREVPQPLAREAYLKKAKMPTSRPPPVSNFSSSPSEELSDSEQSTALPRPKGFRSKQTSSKKEDKSRRVPDSQAEHEIARRVSKKKTKSLLIRFSSKRLRAVRA